jgi:F0F1-type ATP synthase assembly protein I
MKGPLAVMAAGGTFAGTVIVAIIIGIVLDHRLGTSYWVLVLFFAGLALGAYSAWRLIAQAILR